MKLAAALSRRQNNLDLFRLVAAALVIYAHASATSGLPAVEVLYPVFAGHDYSGSIAVKFFFFVSGLVITNSLMNDPSVFRWCTARILRLFPALIGVLMFSAFILGPLVTTLPVGEYLLRSEPYLYVYRNIVGLPLNCCLAWNLPGIFEDHPTRVINGPLWTLPAEFAAYGLVLVAGLLGLIRRRLLASTLLLIAGAASILAPEAIGIMPPGAQKRHLLACFIAGMLAAMWRDRIALRADAAVGLVLLAAMTRNASTYPLFYCAALFYGSLVLSVTAPIMRLRPTADLSYGVYLYGWPSEQIVYYLSPGASLAGHTIYSLVLAFGFALVSWKIVERPAMDLGRRIRAWSRRDADRPADLDAGIAAAN